MTFIVNVTGNLGRDPESKLTASGTGMASAPLAYTPRRRDGRGGWEDAGPTIWLDIVAFGVMADWLVALQKGDRVSVSGPAERRDFTRRDGSADHSLRIRVATLGYVERRKPEPVATTHSLVSLVARDPITAPPAATPTAAAPQPADPWDMTEPLPW